MAIINLWNIDEDVAERMKTESGARRWTYAEYAEHLVALHLALKERAAKGDRAATAMLTEHELQSTGV